MNLAQMWEQYANGLKRDGFNPREIETMKHVWYMGASAFHLLLETSGNPNTASDQASKDLGQACDDVIRYHQENTRGLKQVSTI